MKSYLLALWAEGLKIRRSKVFWVTIVFFAFIPFMMSLIIIIQKYPELADKLGMIGTKANMMKFGEPNWQNFFALINQVIAALGLIGFGFVTSWVFGREYVDNTFKDLLALPTSRTKIVLAKLSAALIWSAILTIIFLLTAVFIGKVIHISGWSSNIVGPNIIKFLVVAVLSMLLNTPVAFLACYSRGYFLPLGFVILTLICANFTGIVGLGPYFPWAIPGIFSIPAGSEATSLGITSYIILFTTSIIGLFSTILWLRFADQK